MWPSLPVPPESISVVNPLRLLMWSAGAAPVTPPMDFWWALPAINCRRRWPPNGTALIIFFSVRFSTPPPSAPSARLRELAGYRTFAARYSWLCWRSVELRSGTQGIACRLELGESPRFACFNRPVIYLHLSICCVGRSKILGRPLPRSFEILKPVSTAKNLCTPEQQE